MTDPNPSASNRDPQTPPTTTDQGIPAPSDEYSLTVGPAGPTVLHDHYVVSKIQHFNRERVPERVVHAKGSGAHGFFEVSEDVTQYTCIALAPTTSSCRSMPRGPRCTRTTKRGR